MTADFDDEIAHPHASFTGDVRLIALRRGEIASHCLTPDEGADFFFGLFQSLPDHCKIAGRHFGMRSDVCESRRWTSQSSPMFAAPGGFKIVGKIGRLAV